MGLTYQNILGIRITTSPKEKILEEIKKWLNLDDETARFRRKKSVTVRVIVTPNPEQVVLAQTNSSFRKILNQADVALPDGIGIALASKFLQQSAVNSKQVAVRRRISGVDFMNDVVRLAEEQRVRIGLIGGFNGLAVKALECLKETHPKLTGWADDGPELLVDKEGNREGPGEAYWASLAKRIVSTDTQIVFVGLGAPKQEYVLERLRWEMGDRRWEQKQGECHPHHASRITHQPVIFMSVGGSFDIIAGRLKRAPLFIRSIGFEWFWRLSQEPWRWRRQRSLIQFIYYVVKEVARTILT